VALFRLIESAGGQIVIDGQRISDMGLHDLRRKLTILPQVKDSYSSSKQMQTFLIKIFCCLLLSNFLHFHLLLQNHWVNFSQAWQNHSMVKGIQNSNVGYCHSSRGDKRQSKANKLTNLKYFPSPEPWGPF
jgi:hypothetical protein